MVEPERLVIVSVTILCVGVGGYEFDLRKPKSPSRGRFDRGRVTGVSVRKFVV